MTAKLRVNRLFMTQKSESDPNPTATYVSLFFIFIFVFYIFIDVPSQGDLDRIVLIHLKQVGYRAIGGRLSLFGSNLDLSIRLLDMNAHPA